MDRAADERALLHVSNHLGSEYIPAIEPPCLISGSGERPQQNRNIYEPRHMDGHMDEQICYHSAFSVSRLSKPKLVVYLTIKTIMEDENPIEGIPALL